jgi:hypothetical protein
MTLLRLAPVLSVEVREKHGLQGAPDAQNAHFAHSENRRLTMRARRQSKINAVRQISTAQSRW